VLAALAHDKKASAGRVPFVLPTAIGRVEIVSDVSRAELRLALSALAVAVSPPAGPPGSPS
jgi:3-dehydroquinate synthetase